MTCIIRAQRAGAGGTLFLFAGYAMFGWAVTQRKQLNWVYTRKAMKKFNPNAEVLTPQETALVVAAESLNIQLRSRAHLLATIDALDLSKESTAAKMPYVLALMSMGFSRTRAIARLGLTKTAVNHWRKSNEDNRARFLEAQSRGELMLEETLLLAAERDPEWANTILIGRDKKDALDQEEEDQKEVYDATMFMQKGKVERVKKDPLS